MKKVYYPCEAELILVAPADCLTLSVGDDGEADNSGVSIDIDIGSWFES